MPEVPTQEEFNKLKQEVQELKKLKQGVPELKRLNQKGPASINSTIFNLPIWQTAFETRLLLSKADRYQNSDTDCTLTVLRIRNTVRHISY